MKSELLSGFYDIEMEIDSGDFFDDDWMLVVSLFVSIIFFYCMFWVWFDLKNFRCVLVLIFKVLVFSILFVEILNFFLGGVILDVR